MRAQRRKGAPNFPNTSSQSANETHLSANSALSNIETVDIEGGWKVGDQYVIPPLFLGRSLSVY